MRLREKRGSVGEDQCSTGHKGLMVMSKKRERGRGYEAHLSLAV